MALPHDDQGFLTGSQIDIEELTKHLESIHDELKAIRTALGNSTSDAGAPAAVPPAPDAPPPSGDNRPTPAPAPAPTPVPPVVAGAPPPSPAPGSGPEPRPAPGPVIADRTRRERAPGGRVAGERDSSGRFTRRNGRGGDDGRPSPSGDSAPSESDTVAGAISGIGARITGALGELGANEEADPSVKAFNEIAQPLTRGFSKIFGGGTDRKQERWYRRFWREMSKKGREDRAAAKREQRLLRDIERNGGGGEGGGGSGGMLGLVGILVAPLIALFGALLVSLKFLTKLSALTGILKVLAGAFGKLKNILPEGVRNLFGGRGGPDVPPGPRPGGGGAARGLLKRIPLIGALLGTAFAVSDVVDSESGDGTRREKDASTGAAVGKGVGGIGGMAGGAALGATLGTFIFPGVGTAIGGLVGGALGGFMGGSAGEVIGEKFGVWVNDLRSSGMVTGIVENWRLTTDFFGGLWQQTSAGVAERWATASTAMSETWASVAGGASALWASVAGTMSKGWASLSSTLSGKWSSAVDSMQKGWGAALDLASKGWDALSGLASDANKLIKEKTGIDLGAAYDAVTVKATELATKAEAQVAAVVGSAKTKANAAVDWVKAGAKTVADKTGVSAVVGGVKKAAKVATNKKAMRQVMADEGITDPNEQAAFMGQMDHESAGFTSMEESFNYGSADRIMAVSKTARDKGQPAVEAARAQGPEAVAELMYGGRMGNVNPGDAHAFRGRGFTQLTGRDNYAAAGKDLGLDLVNNPDLAAEPENAAKVAAWYWKSRPGLSEAAKSGDVTSVTKKINGGTNGLADRQAKTQKYLAEANSGSLTVAPTAAQAGPFDALAQAEAGIEAPTTAAPSNPFAALNEAEAPTKAGPFDALAAAEAGVATPTAPGPYDALAAAEAGVTSPTAPGPFDALMDADQAPSAASPSNPFAALGQPEAPTKAGPFDALAAANQAPATAAPSNPFAALNEAETPTKAGPFDALAQAEAGIEAPATAAPSNPFAALAPSMAPVMAPASGSRPPSTPSVSLPGVTSVPEAPSIPVPMGDGGRKPGRSAAPAQNVPRDLPDRRIAHIVTGAYSGMG